MVTRFKGARISGVLAVLPENEYLYDEETKNFASPATRRLKKIMGFNKRRAAKSTTTSCDFCLYGIRHLLDNNLLKKEEIGAVIVLSVTPDYYMPQMSNIIQGELGLPNDVICMDISQACAAYVLGIYQAAMLIGHLPLDKKVIVCTSDVLCRKEPEWKLAEPSFGGDAATITIMEHSFKGEEIFANIYNDGTQREALIIHAGGFKMPRSPETAIPHDIGDGTMRSYNDLWMDGSAVFNFVQKEVPPMIREILQQAGKEKDEIDWYLFHQPNKFMLQKLAQRLGIPSEKMPMNIVETFGNSSGSCVGVNIAYNLGEKLLDHKYTCCLAGFGGGLAWASAVLDIGNLDFCQMIISHL
ncbi:MAG: ketoacyl-ACP synthase III [Lachnospiraceae bacterium]|nr:ketoacyl-ACP synthase III [Lachnospiraceae bacterium]